MKVRHIAPKGKCQHGQRVFLLATIPRLKLVTAFLNFMEPSTACKKEASYDSFYSQGTSCNSHRIFASDLAVNRTLHEPKTNYYEVHIDLLPMED